MRRALALAGRGWGQTAPNPMVGAVVVAGNAVSGEGFHARYGDAHAEPVALAAAGGSARGATLYVTLEPCAHHGKTPPCADAVIAAGIARVVIAARDPSERARGGVARLRAAGVRADVGIACDAAVELNAAFFNAQAAERPWVTLKLAVTANGAVADPTGRHRWITGPESRREVHMMRANSDTVAVGIGTALADDPSLTVRDVPAPRVPPARVVFDRNLRLPPDSRLVQSASQSRVIVAAAPDGATSGRRERLAAAGVDVLTSATPRETLVMLRARGIRSVLVEGGPRLAGALLAGGLVDRLVIFRSPLVLGDDAPPAFAFAPPGFEATLATRRVVERRGFDDDVMTTYALTELDTAALCSQD